MITILNIIDTNVEPLFELTYYGIIIIDIKGLIIYISHKYCDLLNIDESEALGNDITKVISTTRLHIVLKTGIPEYDQTQEINSHTMIVTRLPIIRNNKITGAIGYVNFKNVNELFNLYNKVSKTESNSKITKYNLRDMSSTMYTLNCIKGNNKQLNFAKTMSKKAAQTNSSVLILGESGTGKELFAHAIHNLSNRCNRSFIKVNCAAIPKELLESELFGYDKGAFTGAKKEGKMGKFELANHGTIFLDEIGDMPLFMQAKLLRVLQDHEIERIGAEKPIKLDIRIISATNKPLSEMIKENTFREDLYYRLNVMTINVPSLRERKDDIEVLYTHFLEKYSLKFNKKINGISKTTLSKIKSYNWPGNIRELQNVIERALNLVDNFGILDCSYLPSEISGYSNDTNIISLDETVAAAEKSAIIEALSISNGNKSNCAKLLKISRCTLYEKLNKYNIK